MQSPPVSEQVVSSPSNLLKHFVPPREYAPMASEEDIFYCFRLLLGRCPKPEEWPGHSSQSGKDLATVVSSFLTCREFANRGLLNRSYSDTVEQVQMPGFALFASREDLAVGCHALQGKAYEPAVTAILKRYLKPGMVAVDIGANIGCLTMLMASLVGPSGMVVAVEPNPENVKLLEASRRLNGFDQVLILQIAAGRQAAILALNVVFSNGMTGGLPDKVDGILASRPVQAFALDAVLPKTRRINLVKIDAEGAELNALIGMSETLRRDRPVIISEFSPGALPGISNCSGPEYLNFFLDQSYQIALIEENGFERQLGTDVGAVMSAYGRSGRDHIDIICQPA